MNATTQQTKQPVAVLGLGAMGSALAGALLEAGHPVTVWNRTASKADALVARGASAAASPAEAVGAAELVIVAIVGNARVRALLEDPATAAALRGRTVANLVNGTPDEARSLAPVVAGLGAEYLDGGIMAVPPMIGTPAAVVLYSGSEPAFARHRGALETLGRATYLDADPGTAALHDLALLAGMYGLFAGFFHSAALVRSAGGSVREFAAEELVPWLTAMASTLPESGALIDAGDYSETGSPLEMQTAEDTIGDLSRAQGVSTELWDPVLDLMRRRVADGHGSEDMAGVVELLRKG